MSKYMALPYNEDGGVEWFVCRRNDGLFLIDLAYQTGKGNLVQWTNKSEDATQFKTDNDAIEHGLASEEMAELRSEKPLVDQYVDEIWNLHGFTNEELETIRNYMVRYANDVLHDSKVAKQNAAISDEYSQSPKG